MRPDWDDLQDAKEYAVSVLDFWLGIHTDPIKWAENWIAGYGYMDYLIKFGSRLINSYFEYDFMHNLIELVVDRHFEDVQKCNQCGQYIYIQGDDPCECEGDQNLVELNAEEKIDFLSEMYPNVSSLIGVFPITDSDCRYIWERKAFAAYYDNLEPVFRGELENITAVINALESAEDETGLMRALIDAHEVQHVHGNVIQDYGDHVNDGNADYFGALIEQIQALHENTLEVN